MSLIRHKEAVSKYALTGSQENQKALLFFQKKASYSTRQPVSSNDCVCHKCWQRFIRSLKKHRSNVTLEEDVKDDSQS